MKPLSTHSLYELQILPSGVGDASLLTLLNQAHTYPGKEQIQALLTSPLTSLAQIEQRQKLIQFTSQHLAQLDVKVPHGYLTAAQNHLASNLAWDASKTGVKRYQTALWLRWFRPYDFYQLQSGTAALQRVLSIIDQRTAWWRNSDLVPDEWQPSAQVLRSFFARAGSTLTRELTLTSLLEIDYFLRYQSADQVKAVFTVFYRLDAFCGIARFLQTANWSYPVFVRDQGPIFQLTALRHPLLDEQGAIATDFSCRPPQRLTLLTGGNMSGKTTFLKTCGLVVYLAHLGLPVPAQALSLSFVDCLLTSIHLSDNLALGYSHFYAELMHIKEAAQALSDGQRVFLLADELFQGTNPQDAVLCARQVIDCFMEQSGSLFIISSHLPQLGLPYQAAPKVQFAYFRTQVVLGQLVFTYRLEPGVIEEQTGWLLLQQTGVLAGLQENRQPDDVS
ncbi:MutS family DNA mismatch repair protein [Spirosoma migulaei]